MAIMIACDHPEGNDEEPFDPSDSVQIVVEVSDPESGTVQARAFYCTGHGDKVVSQLTDMGFPPLIAQ